MPRGPLSSKTSSCALLSWVFVSPCLCLLQLLWLHPLPSCVALSQCLLCLCLLWLSLCLCLSPPRSLSFLCISGSPPGSPRPLSPPALLSIQSLPLCVIDCSVSHSAEARSVGLRWMDVSLLPLKKDREKNRRDLPRGRESLAARCIIGTEPVDDTSFSQIPPPALSCLFPFLVGQSPKGNRDSGKGPGQHTRMRLRPGRIHVPTVQSGTAYHQVS